MNRKITGLLCIIVIDMLIMSIPTFQVYAVTTGKVYVDPTRNVFSTDPEAPNYAEVGDTFDVNVTVADFVEPGLFAYAFRIHYNPAILGVVGFNRPADHFFAGADFTPVSNADPVAGWVEIGASLLGATPGRTGSGVLVTVTFNITAAPPLAGVLSCILEVEDTGFLDYDLAPCVVTIEHGYYEYAAPMPPLPYLKVEPESVSAKNVGDEVDINVTIQQLVTDWKAVGFQWKLIFNTTILGFLNATEGDFLKKFGLTYFYAIQEADYVISFSLQYKEPWPPTVFPEGSGTLATIRFNATYKPTFIDMVASCPLHLTEVLIVNVDANPIQTRPSKDGFYQIAIAAPPWLSISPKEYTASALGELFDLGVFINELDADWRMVGAEFKIRYNMTLLDLVNITEGGFMKHFATESGTDTWFQWYNETDPMSKYGIVGIMIYPLPNATWPGPFPDTTDYGAPGDLAIVTFKAIKQWDEIDVTDERAMWLDEIILANTEVMEIPYNAEKTAIEGKCKYTIKRAVPSGPPPIENGIDLYTQYPWWFGGQGLNTASDAFPPQGAVKLNAKVTYHFDPVPGKPVSYELIAPSGVKHYATAFTNADGIATFDFSLPASEFGLWIATASVPLAGNVYTDKLRFLEGWLVEIVNVEIRQPPYMFNATLPGAYKGEPISINVTSIRICIQDPRKMMDMILKNPQGEPIVNNDLLLHIALTDELNQLTGSATLNTSQITELSVGYDFLEEFVTTVGLNWENRIALIQANYTKFVFAASNGVTISPAAFSGVATIHANVLTDLPGVAYCPEGTRKVWIKKRT
jgi:hypothetical protein